MWWKYCKHLLPLPEKLKGSQPKSRSVLHRGYIGPRRSTRVFPKILCFFNIYQELTLEVVSHGRTLRRILLRAPHTGINETGATRGRDPTLKRIWDLFRILIWRLPTPVTPQPRLCQIKARHLFLHVVFIKLEQKKKEKGKKKPITKGSGFGALGCEQQGTGGYAHSYTHVHPFPKYCIQSLTFSGNTAEAKKVFPIISVDWMFWQGWARGLLIKGTVD